MKIRIKGNSLRYRLTRTEVSQVATTGYLEDTTNFGSTQLTYAIKKAEADNLSAQFENNIITLYIPKQMTQEWIDTDRVGFEHTHNGLYLLVEKDFVCLDNTTEDQSDNYPHPNTTC
jgi:hypothetical protein